MIMRHVILLAILLSFAVPPLLRAQDATALHQRAENFIQSKDYKNAAAEYEKILVANPRDTRALYNLACVYSLLNDRAKAVEFLKKAVDSGWTDFHHIEADPDLNAIRDEAAYKEIVRILKAASAAPPRTPNFEEDAKRIIVKPLEGSAANNPTAQKAWKQINESSAIVLKNIYEICGLALPPNKRVDVYFRDQPGNSRPGQIVYAVTYPAAFGSYMHVSLPIMMRNNQNYMHIYQHEMVHALQQSIMGHAAYWSNVLHEWIREGLATYVGGHGPERIAKFGRGGNTSFINGLENHAVPADYAEGYLAFLYMEKNWGRDGVVSFVRDITYKRTPWKQAIKNLSGKDWTAFQSDVRQFSIAHVKQTQGGQQVARQDPPPDNKPATPPSAAPAPPQPPTVAPKNPTTVPTLQNTPRAAAVDGKPYFGAHLSDLDAETAQTYNLKNGVLIIAVRSGTPADEAGFDAGDVITKFNGVVARNAAQLNSLIAESKPGDSVTVEVNREGSPLTLKVIIGAQP
jgi:tetratricopeptide (TPR) repeat protein